MAATREAEALASVPPHPHLLSLVSFTEAADHSILALPLATGGDTLKYMQERGCVPLSEDSARPLFVQLVDAVSHMHKNGFVHRDIKCENILLAGPERRDIILGDFGFAGRWKAGERLTQAWGSHHYSSPEISARVPYEGPEVDVWSMGVVLYAWCSGRLPFGGATEEETSARIQQGMYSLPRQFSTELKTLISGMLHLNPAKRLTLDDVRAHPWVQQDGSDDAYFALRRRDSPAYEGVFFPAVPPVTTSALTSPPTTRARASSSAKRRMELPRGSVVKRTLFRDEVDEC